MITIRPSNFKCTVFLALLIAFQLTTGCAQPKSELTVKIEKILHEQFDAEGPGFAMMVAQHGEILYHGAYGKADLELDAPMRTDNVFRIASLTKQFTAVAILQLASQNKLSLQDDITAFLPDYPQSGITVEHLLTHTSGISDFTKLPSFNAEVARQSLTVPQQIDRFKDEPLNSEPGSSYMYSNSNYTLLGSVIEAVSELSYQAYMERHVFKPFNLNRTYYGQDASIIERRANGYSKSEDSYINAAYVNDMLPYASGALLSTTNDLYTWHKALVSGQIVDTALLEKAQSPFTLSSGEESGYGYGWQIGIMNDQSVIFHSGAINGFLCDMLYLPESDLFVVALTNCDCNPPAPSIIQIVDLLVKKGEANPGE